MIKVNRIYLFSQFISSGSILLKSEFQWFGIEESLFNRKGRGEEWGDGQRGRAEGRNGGMGKEEGQRGGLMFYRVKHLLFYWTSGLVSYSLQMY